jgi:hypothetical protein
MYLGRTQIGALVEWQVVHTHTHTHTHLSGAQIGALVEWQVVRGAVLCSSGPRVASTTAKP